MSSNQEVRPVILVVDNDEAVRKIIQTHTQDAGYEVLLASRGKAAISTAAVKRPDLLITNILMPEMDGLEVILHFRKEFPATKIIAMLDANKDATLLNAARLLGAHGALLKPLQQDELIEAIRQQIGRKEH